MHETITHEVIYEGDESRPPLPRSAYGSDGI
jgi:hypothetical protein